MAARRYYQNGTHVPMVLSVDAEGRWLADCFCGWRCQRSSATASDAHTMWERHVRDGASE